MRLLLDGHLSGRRVGAPLRRRGHDVEALHEEPGARSLSDEQVLERATAAGRILVNRDGRDLIELARAWSEAGQSHAGILVVWGRSSTASAEIVAAIQGALSAGPEQAAWVDLVLPA